MQPAGHGAAAKRVTPARLPQRYEIREDDHGRFLTCLDSQNVVVRIDPKNNEAVVSFWVSRDGRLIGEPEILKHALDPAIGNSAINAVKAAAPFPPLPGCLLPSPPE